MPAPQLIRQTLRLRADETSRDFLIDANTNATPTAWARASTQMQVALATGGALVDVSNISTVTLEASPFNSRDAARVLSKTVAAADLFNSLTEQNWADGTKQHAVFDFSSAEMNVALSLSTQADFWLVITALTLAGDPIVCGEGKLTIIDPGTFNSAPPPPANPGAGITIDQADSRYAPKTEFAAYQITAKTGTVTLPAGTRRAVLGGLTGNLTLVLPLSTGYSNGQDVIIEDVVGYVGGHTVDALPQGSDELDGDNVGDGPQVLFPPGRYLPQATIRTNGTGQWQIVTPLAAIATSGAASDLIGLVPLAHLGTGAPSSATFLRGDGTWATPGATVAADVFVDSNAGNDHYNGTSASSPLKSLAAAQSAAITHGAGARVALAAGSYWRETLDLSTVSNAVILSYGAGAPPVIDGADVFTAWTKTTGRTSVYQTSVTHNADTSSDWRLTVYADDHLLLRVVDLATCDSTPGSFVDVKASDGSPVTVYIHPSGGTNPASDGHLYEVTTRAFAFSGGNGAALRGVQCRRAITNDGAVELSTRTGVTVEQVLTRDGTKHCMVFGSGTIRDTIALGGDGPTSYEASNVAFTAYLPDPTGVTVLAERCATLAFLGGDWLAHGNGPSYASVTLRQCWVAGGSLYGGVPNGNNGTGDGCYYDNTANVSNGGTLLRSMYRCRDATGPQASSTNLYEPAWTDCALYFAQRTNNLELFRNTDEGYYWNQCAISGLGGFNTVFYNSVASGTGEIIVNHSIIFGGNSHAQVPNGMTFAGNHNVYFCTTNGPAHLSYHGIYYSLSDWQDVTNQDVYSVYLLAADQTAGNANAFWLAVKNAVSGTDVTTIGPVTGDWRINPAAKVYSASGTAFIGTFPDGTPITTAGPQTHWDWNARASATGTVTRWPNPPVTLADAQAYTRNPSAWVF